MSSTPTVGSAAANSSGRWVIAAPTSSPPLDRPCTANCAAVVTPDVDQIARAQANRSSNTCCLWCSMPGPVPVGAELPAAAQVRHGQHPAGGDPGREHRGERRQHRDVESAVAVEQGRPRTRRQVGAAQHRHRDRRRRRWTPRAGARHQLRQRRSSPARPGQRPHRDPAIRRPSRNERVREVKDVTPTRSRPTAARVFTAVTDTGRGQLRPVPMGAGTVDDLDPMRGVGRPEQREGAARRARADQHVAACCAGRPHARASRPGVGRGSTATSRPRGASRSVRRYSSVAVGADDVLGVGQLRRPPAPVRGRWRPARPTVSSRWAVHRLRESVPGLLVSTSQRPSGATHGSAIQSRSGGVQTTSSTARSAPSRCSTSSPAPIASVNCRPGRPTPAPGSASTGTPTRRAARSGSTHLVQRSSSGQVARRSATSRTRMVRQSDPASDSA